MKVLLVGTGGVGEAIASIAKGQAWMEQMVLTDYNRERLKEVQQRADAGDPAATRIFDTIGVYLGYAIPHYADFYDLANLLILGRVTSGRGGEIILEGAQKVLRAEFPQLAERMNLQLPDEKSRRVGQSIAAASLPEILPHPTLP